MVVFDCERLKVPDTGIYYFCMNLASALIDEAASENIGISFFLRKRNVGILDKKCDYFVYRSIYKYLFPYHRLSNGVWHSSFQYPLIMPKNRRTVLTIHDLNFLHEDMPEPLRMELRDKLQAAVDRSRYIVAISEFTKKDIIENLDTNGKPVSVIYNGCNRYEGNIDIPEYRPSGRFLFTIGALLPKKNFHTLPCLLKDNDFELVIAGPRYGYENTILKEAQSCGVMDRVHIIGTVSEAEKHWYLKNCTAFLFPSKAEGFGLPVLEAMQYGKPVFLSKHTSLPEIGSDKAFYFNYEFDSLLMREEFNRGIEDFQAGRIRPEEISGYAAKFSWKDAASQYIDIYKQLLNGVYDI